MRRIFAVCLVLICLVLGAQVTVWAAPAPGSGSTATSAPNPTPAAPANQDEAKAATGQPPSADDRQAAESAAGQLRQAAESAGAAAQEVRLNDSIWEGVFKQSQAELDAIAAETASLDKELEGLILPLRNNLSGLEESTRRLLAVSDSQRANPFMLDAILRRSLQLSGNLIRQMEPVRAARDLVRNLSEGLEQVRRNLLADMTSLSAPADEGPPAANAAKPRTPSDAKIAGQIRQIESKLGALAKRLERPLKPAEALLDRLTGMQERVIGYLPTTWVGYYMSVPDRFFEPTAWQGMGERLARVGQDMALRLSVELPQTPGGWQSFALRVLNMLLLGGVALFFANRWLRRLERNQPETFTVGDRRRILRSLVWLMAGLAALAASVTQQGEVFRLLLVVGSMLAIWGELALAWNVRCRTLGQSSGRTPLWPLYAQALVAVALCYLNLPQAVLSLLWVMVAFAALWLTRFPRQEGAVPPLEGRLLDLHRMALWVSLAVAALGWARVGILFIVGVDCLLVSVQFGVGLMQCVNRSAEGAEGTPEEEQARNSIISGLFAAFVAPTLLALVTVGMCLWVIAMPGGALLLWHYLEIGVSIGSFSFNTLHVLLILSLFYITRAAIVAAQHIMDRLATSPARLDANLIAPMRTIITYGLWLLFGLFTLRALGFSLANLAVIAGGLSVGIGFGLQTIVNNFLSGLILIFSRTLHEGDIVEVGGLQGRVRKISIRATTIETGDNAVIFVPNAEFVSNRLINWTRNGRSVRRDVRVGVAYGTDPAKVENLLLEVARANEHVLMRPQPYVVFADFADSTLNFALYYWADISSAQSAASAMRKEIARVFADRDINIAFPQLDVHLIAPRPGVDAATQEHVAAGAVGK